MATAAEATYAVLTPGISQLKSTTDEYSETLELPKQVATEYGFAQPVSEFVLIVGTAPPSARSETILFGALKAPDLKLRRPIPLTLSTEGSEVVLTWPETEEFGCGSTMGDALEDFAHGIRNLYRHLHSQDIRLGPDLENVKRVLGEYIEERARI